MEKKIIKVGKKVIVVATDGNDNLYSMEKEVDNAVFGDFYDQIMAADTIEAVFALMNDHYHEEVEECKKSQALMERIKNSSILKMKGDSVYWEAKSPFSMPQTFVEAVLDAEEAENQRKLDAFGNFWTLMALNPDEECRQNLFWFLQKYGLRISRHGFFVAYRNVDRTNKRGVYTDHHSHTFKIRIGEPVSMPRENCDCSSDVTCSRGLHLAGREWLTRNYFGEQGLVCLCNPAAVVAVPHEDNYGKLRTCEYLPIGLIEYGDDDHPLEFPEEDGFDCEAVADVIYDQIIDYAEKKRYTMDIKDMPACVSSTLKRNLLDIAILATRERNI